MEQLFKDAERYFKRLLSYKSSYSFWKERVGPRLPTPCPRRGDVKNHRPYGYLQLWEL